jgi:hypothetical protein
MALLIGLWTVFTTKVRSRRFAAMASGRCRPGTCRVSEIYQDAVQDIAAFIAGSPIRVIAGPWQMALMVAVLPLHPTGRPEDPGPGPTEPGQSHS